MTKQEILSWNRIIAEFMSRSFQMSHIDDYKGAPDNELPKMKYHYDWGSLMPVVKKIQQLKIHEFAKKKPVMDALLDVDISILYTAVVAFIQWDVHVNNKKRYV
jgi:hypothetical protein